MSKILTCSFDSVDAARNAVDELVNAGFPRGQVMREDHGSTVKVMTPGAPEDEVLEILERHDPASIKERPAWRAGESRRVAGATPSAAIPAASTSVYSVIGTAMKLMPAS